MTDPDPYYLVVSVLVEHLGLEETTIRPTSTFEELGVDSLALVEVALVLRERLDANLEGTVDLYTTVGETADLLRPVSAALSAPTAAPAGAAAEAVL